MLVLVLKHSHKTVKTQTASRMNNFAVKGLIKIHLTTKGGTQNKADTYGEVDVFYIHQSEVGRNDVQSRRFE